MNRTLTLLDGRRVVSSNRFGTVDVNMFPASLMKGIETVTGGASATYGTDAVAGVVNFLLDTEFTGLKTHLQAGKTTRNDGQNWEAGIAFGHAFGERLHLLASFDATNQDPIASERLLRERSYFKQVARVTNPDPTGPREIIRPYVAPTNFSYGGLIVEPNFPALNPIEFLPGDQTRQFPFSGVGSLNGGYLCMASTASEPRAHSNEVEAA